MSQGEETLLRLGVAHRRTGERGSAVVRLL